MNEIDFIRQQLAAERAHLREILNCVRRETAAGTPRAILAYLDWAAARLLQRLAADQVVAPLPGATAGRAEQLLALLDATEPPAAAANHGVHIGQWRQTARLTADSILEERRLYAAARRAAGLP
ncbi:MAG TPA: hypothetical protein VMF03_01725 [Steroidobacteraceae bacterium]|nr:hypothetical protein [Steroidobacteraceae bacterium]